MYRCSLCHFETEPDDAVLPRPNGMCICLRCYLRAVGKDAPMPIDLRREVIALLISA
jgi:hypothetical protein